MRKVFNMDPLGIRASLIYLIDRALQTTSALVKYARDNKDLSFKRILLVEQTLLLSKLLQRLRDRALSAPHDETWLADHKDVVGGIEDACEVLALTLKFDVVTGKIKEESRLGEAHTLVKWSFRKSNSVYETITGLQQYANKLLVDEQQSVLQTSRCFILVVLNLGRLL